MRKYCTAILRKWMWQGLVATLNWFHYISTFGFRFLSKLWENPEPVIEIDDYTTCAGVKVPTEMWNKIFRMLGPTLDSKKDILAYRKVCRQWTDVIDDVFDFHVLINDEKWKFQSYLPFIFLPYPNTLYMSHLRVSSCAVAHFCKKLPEGHRVFQVLTNDLLVTGRISADNFQKLMECAHRVRNLAFSFQSLCSTNLSRIPCTDINFQHFWGNLSKLVIDLNSPYARQEITQEIVDALQNNLSHLFNCRMANLNRLLFEMNILGNCPVRVNCEATVASIISFLGEHPKLNLLQVVIMGCPALPEFYELFENVRDLELQLQQVNSLSLAITVSSTHLRVWIHLINLLNLNKLRVTIRHLLRHENRSYEHTYLMEHLEGALRRNQETLTSVEIRMFCARQPVNAEIFSGMNNLNRLVLQRSREFDESDEIINLELLPPSIKTLELRGMRGNSEDILAMANNLERLRIVRLFGMGQPVQEGGFGVNEQARQIFAIRENIEVDIEQD